MTISTPWRVWLDDARLQRVRAALDALGNQLLALPDDAIPQPPGLVSGLPGVALAHGYLAQAGCGEAHAERCAARLEAAVATVEGLAGDGSLARGLAGFAFVLEHLGANEDEDICADFDAILERDARDNDVAAEMMWGLAGRAIYAHERRERPSTRALAGAVVERMLALAEPQPDGGVAWRADARFAGPTAFDGAGNLAYNLGVAHGTPGIVAVLAASDEPRALEAARAGMRWIWAQRFVDGDGAFPVVAGGPPYSGHGWCYGDEGIGAAMVAAARALGDETWQARWLEVLRGAARRAPSVGRELSLCHGGAGLAHMWHRVYQTSGEPLFADAARAWLDATLDGLATLEPDGPGILDGAAGIALALAAFVGDVEPAWDRLFLLSHR